MVQHIPARDAAKLLRAELKEKFPHTKFSVRTDHGTTLNVDWTDGPSTAQVKDIADKYAGQGFDGMVDMRYYTGAGHTTEDGERIEYLTDFVFVHRNISPEVMAELQAEVAASIAEDYNTTVEKVLEGHAWWPAPQLIMRETGTCPEGPLYSHVIALAEYRAEA